MSTDPAAHHVAPDRATSTTRHEHRHAFRTGLPTIIANERADDHEDLPPDDHLDVRSFSGLIAAQHITTPTFLTFENTVGLETMTLDPEDPVERLFGIVVRESVNAVGICAPATVISGEWGPGGGVDHVVIHVVNRQGTSMTTLTDASGSRWFGPTAEPQRGRVPDACRRALALPTSPPVDSMTDFVLAAWLEVITRHALEDPGLEWSEIISFHPATHSVAAPITPTSLARATLDLGNALDWDRFRRVIATVGGFPFGERATEIAAWMDEGMFSRWAMESIPTRDEALDLLESVLGPGTFDRLWATVRMTQ